MVKHAAYIKVLIISAIALFMPSDGTCKEPKDPYLMEDKALGLVHRSRVTVTYKVSEHKNGKVTLKTNNLGFRKDTDTKIKKEKGVVRILVTGDSHIDGIVNNNESFPNLLENKLNSENKKMRFEVINGAVSYWGFDNYYTFLRRYLFLKPDVYIIVVYAGNDFLNSAITLEGKGIFNKRPPKYLENLRSLRKYGWSWAPVFQAVNQIYYFKTFPKMKERTAEHALDVISKMHALCKSYGIDFIVVFLPTKLDVEWQRDKTALENVKKHLRLDEADLRINRDMTEFLIKGVAKKNIKFLDLYESMRNQPTELYWKKDYHLNVEGHKFLTEKMYEKYGDSFFRIETQPASNG